jgi:hypothetical protein
MSIKNFMARRNGVELDIFQVKRNSKSLLFHRKSEAQRQREEREAQREEEEQREGERAGSEE